MGPNRGLRLGKAWPGTSSWVRLLRRRSNTRSAVLYILISLILMKLRLQNKSIRQQLGKSLGETANAVRRDSPEPPTPMSSLRFLSDASQFFDVSNNPFEFG